MPTQGDRRSSLTAWLRIGHAEQIADLCLTAGSRAHCAKWAATLSQGRFHKARSHTFHSPDSRTGLSCRLHRTFSGTLTVVLLVALELVANAQDCVRWIPRTDVGSPGNRWSPAMAYDSDRGVTVLFGGAAFPIPLVVPLDDTWEFDGTEWRRITIDGPSPDARALSAMCYDTVRHEMVLFGGLRNAFIASLNDTWVYRSNGPGHGIWTRKRDLKTSTTPDYSVRAGHTMVFDNRRGVAVMVGGTTDESTGTGGPPSQRVSEVWEWSGESWANLHELFPVRAGAYYKGPSLHAMAYDSDTGTLSIGGGAYYYFLNGKFDEWSDLDWPSLVAISRTDSSYVGEYPGRPIGGTDIGARQHHAVAYDTHRKRIVIFGGIVSGDIPKEYPGNRHDEAVFLPGDPPRYSATRLNISTPPAREGHAMVYDIRRQRVVLFGGIREGNPFGDTWEYGLGAVPIVYVDGRNSATQDGSLAQPHRTVRQAAIVLDNCPAILSIQAGDYIEGTLTITKSVTLEARNGPVRIH